MMTVMMVRIPKNFYHKKIHKIGKIEHKKYSNKSNSCPFNTEKR